jgi:hypothetical protein
VRVRCKDLSVNAVGDVIGVFVRIKHKFTVRQNAAFFNVAAGDLYSCLGHSAISSSLLAVIT